MPSKSTSPNENALRCVTEDALVVLDRCYAVMTNFAADISHENRSKVKNASLDLTRALTDWRKTRWNKEENEQEKEIRKEVTEAIEKLKSMSPIEAHIHLQYTIRG